MKCGDEIPCKRCIDKGLAYACHTGDQKEVRSRRPGPVPADPQISESPSSTKLTVQRPLKSRNRRVAIMGQEVDYSQLFPCGPTSEQEEVHQIIRKVSGMGNDQISLVLNTMSARTRGVLLNTFRTIKSIPGALRKLKATSSVSQSQGQAPKATGLNLETLEYLAQDGMESSSGADRAWMCRLFDMTRLQSSEYMINGKFAEMLGMHSEEVLARMANAEMRMPAPTLDTFSRMLGIVCDNTEMIKQLFQFPQREYCFRRCSYELLYRGGFSDAPAEATPILVKHEQTVRVLGRAKVRADSWFTHVTPAEYDRALYQQGENCRGLLGKSGDRTPASELLSMPFTPLSTPQRPASSKQEPMIAMVEAAAQLKLQGNIDFLINALGRLDIKPALVPVPEPPTRALSEDSGSLRAQGEPENHHVQEESKEDNFVYPTELVPPPLSEVGSRTSSGLENILSPLANCADSNLEGFDQWAQLLNPSVPVYDAAVLDGELRLVSADEASSDSDWCLQSHFDPWHT